MAKQVYAIEWNGDYWQSVFPETEAEKSALHTTVMEALHYMLDLHGVAVDSPLILAKAR